jgi:hypothetical protein
MTVKHRVAKLEQQIHGDDVPIEVQLVTPPDNLSLAEQQAFAERNTVTVTMRTLKRILDEIDGTTTGLPGLR